MSIKKKMNRFDTGVTPSFLVAMVDVMGIMQF